MRAPLAALLCATVLHAAPGDREAVLTRVRASPTHAMVPVPEGRFVAAFHPDVKTWIGEPFTPARVAAIRAKLADRLRIELGPRGFVQAAERTPGAKDDTNYDAVWVRDAVWAYHALDDDPARAADAARLLRALWDFYGQAGQSGRMLDIIRHPMKRLDPMAMPLVRFDGRDPRMSHVMKGGEPERWNHRQVDAHGLFFAALGEAVERGRVTLADLTRERSLPLALFPRFLEQLDFSSYEDGGAWEELDRRNTSSIGLATRALQVWRRLAARRHPIVAALPQRMRAVRAWWSSPDARASLTAWQTARLDAQIARGLACVRRQLALGGESPEYPPTDLRFRRADAALLALVSPAPLPGLSDAELRLAVTIVDSLERPAGVLRYENDSYQCGDFWIRPPATAQGPTGDTSSLQSFRARMAELAPHTEAQWFFDSWRALAYLELASRTRDPRQRAADVHAATVCVKRALGQLTGPDALAADGKPVRPLEATESINTIVDGPARYWLPSPITPLNWAKATLAMALARLERALR